MKYVVVLGDGMADYPVPELGDKTPLQVAHKPHIDTLVRQGQLGLVKTVPDGFDPGSDTANLSILGYDPQLYYTGRSPLEAASMGIKLREGDLAFRCNLVTLSDDEPYEDKIMLDHSADEISSAEARKLLEAVKNILPSQEMSLYPGVGYRHLLVWHNAPTSWELTAPHDILDQCVSNYLPRGPQGAVLLAFMKQSVTVLKDHPVNLERKNRGLRPANSVWIWGEGTKPQLPAFSDKYGLRGAVISAVDLIKGLGVCAGLEVLEVEGATGNINTNFRGKTEAALSALRNGLDFLYLHLEAPDECGHHQDRENKIRSIELIDEQVIKPLISGLEALNEPYRLLFLPDHATPLALRTHTADPVPFLLFDSTKPSGSGQLSYHEEAAKETGLFIEVGHTLMDYFLNKTAGGK
ncbi:MAG: cofactor-independent phosphoglycerate mutase [Firmicutes bacterium]|nr:cofactor-independent phosphoglycerate mutase [Bacillota bacterium]